MGWPMSDVLDVFEVRVGVLLDEAVPAGSSSGDLDETGHVPAFAIRPEIEIRFTDWD